MALWDATIGWVTLVVRAPSAEQARELAIAEVGSMGLFDGTFEEPTLSEEWPLELSPAGPTEILVQDGS